MTSKKLLTASLVLAIACATAGGVWAQEEAVDRAGIAVLLKKLSDAWDRHDAEALASLWSPGGDYVNATGRAAEGQGELQRLFETEQKGVMRGTRIGVKLVRARQLGDRMAFIDCEVELRGVEAADGRTMPPLDHLLSGVVVSSDEGWHFLAVRLSVPVPAAPR